MEKGPLGHERPLIDIVGMDRRGQKDLVYPFLTLYNIKKSNLKPNLRWPTISLKAMNTGESPDPTIDRHRSQERRNMILTHQEGPVVTITIHRPDSLNTLTHDLILKLTNVIKSWRDKEGIRLFILTGSGDRAFVGGVDVRAMMDLDPEGAERFITDLHLCFQAIREARQIVMASINGYALGGGLELAASCDLRLAADHARFGMPEVRVGIPSVIEAALLPRLIGLTRAAELVYTGEMIEAQEAERLGLINKVVPRQKLEEATRQWAEKILQNGPTAMILQKRLIAQWMERNLGESIEAGIGAFRDCFKTPEPGEGMRAFLEKRPPAYLQKK